MTRLSFLFILLITYTGCSTSKKINAVNETNHQKWKQKRLENLKSPKGYLSLAGLYWLEEGTYRVGSDRSNDIIFPILAPLNVGTLIINKDSYKFNATMPVLVNGETKESFDMYSDLSGKMTEVNHGTFYWHIIERGNKRGIRLKDTLNDVRLNLTSVKSYKYNSDFVVPARVELAKPNETVSITNVVGVTQDQKVGGTLFFELDGKEYSLIGLGDGYGSWFFVFGDETNSDTTYGGGRFLYVDVTDGLDNTILDFNYAHNPPCFFTSFATCPLPPKENKLPIRIEAGEKSDH